MRLRATIDRVSSNILVTCCPCAWGVLVPCRMTESYRTDTEEIRATAIYSNFRRFQVIVESNPKK